MRNYLSAAREECRKQELVYDGAVYTRAIFRQGFLCVALRSPRFKIVVIAEGPQSAADISIILIKQIRTFSYYYSTLRPIIFVLRSAI